MIEHNIIYIHKHVYYIKGTSKIRKHEGIRGTLWEARRHGKLGVNSNNNVTCEATYPCSEATIRPLPIPMEAQHLLADECFPWKGVTHFFCQDNLISHRDKAALFLGVVIHGGGAGYSFGEAIISTSTLPRKVCWIPTKHINYLGHFNKGST